MFLFACDNKFTAQRLSREQQIREVQECSEEREKGRYPHYEVRVDEVERSYSGPKGAD